MSEHEPPIRAVNRSEDQDDGVNVAARSAKNLFLAGAAVTGIVGGAALGLQAGQAAQREITQRETLTNIAEAHAEETAYADSINEAINAHYDTQQSLETVSVEQGGVISQVGFDLIKKTVGEDEFKSIYTRIYDPLTDSIKLREATGQLVQPGQNFDVVATDLNPDLNNGTEYIMVPSDQVIHSQVDAIPAPETR